MQKVTVNTNTTNYPIYVEEGLFSNQKFLTTELKSKLVGSRVCIITNATVRNLYGRLAEAFFGGLDVTFFEIEDGEQYKSFQTYRTVIDFLVSKEFDRTLNLVALGGGVVGDLCGFVSATYLRGVNFIQIPTTLLAQVDSSVGGKTGINHPAGKNLIGAFYQPSAVLIDPDVLLSLLKREYVAGLAEVIKYGLIYDQDFFSWIESNASNLASREIPAVATAITRSCEIKAEIVSLDDRELGIRAILNFGHIVGHAIETLTQYSIPHGQAVALGMYVSNSLNNTLSKELEEETLSLVSNKNPLRNIDYNLMKDVLMRDKKSVGEDIEVMVTCPDDKKTQVPMSIHIDDIKVHKEKDHERDIKLDDTYTLRMKYPSLDEFIKNNFGAVENMNVDDTFDLISSCVDQVFSEEESWASEDCSKKELNDFIESLNSVQFKKVEKFFETMPKLSHTIEVVNPNTKEKSSVVLEGLADFFA